MHDWDIILLENWSGHKAFEQISVPEGVYKTLINLGKGVPTDRFDEEENSRELNLLLQIKSLDEENRGLVKAYDEYFGRTIDLEQDVIYLLDEIQELTNDEHFKNIIKNLKTDIEIES